MSGKEIDQKERKHRKREADSETTTKDDLAVARREKKRQRREEKERLEKLLPKTDKNGIMYTKQQLRRMRKRVARGLDPIETEQEKQERLARDAELRREEQAELEGILHDGERMSGDNDDKDAGDDGNDVGDVEEAEDEHSSQDGSEQKLQEETVPPAPQPTLQPQKKIKPSGKKPVPGDYVCSACQNKGGHWIYDCPNKITMPGSNQKSKKQRGVHNPDPRKVFVSGLPFDAKHADVKKLFASCGPFLHLKILEFPDTGRCKGQAIVTFKTIEGMQKALTLHGTTIDNNVGGEKKGPSSETKRKDLKLSVTKALNRVASKAKKRNNSK